MDVKTTYVVDYRGQMKPVEFNTYQKALIRAGITKGEVWKRERFIGANGVPSIRDKKLTSRSSR